MDQAVQLGAKRSRLLAAYSAAEASSREMAISAGQRPDPVLTLGLTNVPVNGDQRFSLTRDFMTMRSVGLMQQLTRGDKLAARSSRQLREAEVAEARRLAALTQLKRDTAQAWFDVHYSARILALLQMQRAETALQVEGAEASYRAQRGSQADIFATRSAMARLDDRISQAKTQLAAARTRLVRWAGEDGMRPLAQPPPQSRAPLDPATLEAELEKEPTVTLLAAQKAAAQAQADIARTEKKADWRVEVMLSTRGPAFSDMLSVNFAVPLQWDQQNRQDRELAARLATVEQLQQEREEALRAQVALARERLQQWQSRLDRMALYQGSLLPLATQRAEAALTGYRAGKGPLGAVLEARRMDIDIQLEALRLEMEAASLWVQLTYLIPENPPATATRPGATQ
ncbi:MAG: TolC family protein [Ramlibacter sp.]